MNRKFLQKFAAGILSLSIIFGASAEAAESPAKKIVINSASRFLSLYEGDKKVAMYPLGLGKVSTPTPTGYYKIRTKEVNPSWIDPSHPEYEVPSGPNNPLGYRWMQIQGNYGIHGTNRPNSIGGYVSNGCVRMLEKDVEELFDKVSIGTPVEITYNRVVVEKIDDGNIVYYIYPDGYRWQKLSVDSVNKWLDNYGVSPFESDEEIAKKIKNSDGNPTFIGKPYNVRINGEIVHETEQNGKKFFAQAVVRDKIIYLPAVPIAMTLKTKLEWRPSESTLKTSQGEVTGYELKHQIYINADDAPILFGLDCVLENISDNAADGKIFAMRSIAIPPNYQTEIIQPSEITEPKAEKPNAEESEIKNSATETPATVEKKISPTKETVTTEIIEIDNVE